MKKVLLLISIVLVICNCVKSQSLSINTDGSAASSSAMLDVKSTVKGMLIPRMSKTERQTIAAPAAGLMVYQNAPDSTGFYFYNGTTWWWMISTGNIQGADTTVWKRTGNAGTNSTLNFLGTTDNRPMRFRINNLWAGEIDSASRTVSFGLNAGASRATGFANIAIGAGALNTNTSSSQNIAIGDSALYSSAVSKQTAIGHNALRKNTTGYDNTVMGYQAMYSNLRGYQNVAIGLSALTNDTTGHDNVAIGHLALNSTFTGTYLTAVGAQALYSNIGGYVNTAVGFRAMYSNINGSYNTSIGEYCLNGNLNGDENTAAGNFAMQNNTNGHNNVGIGVQALYKNSVASWNVAVGENALYNNTIGENNTAIGGQTLSSMDGKANNTAIGFYAGGQSNDNNCTYIGYDANNYTGTTYDNSTALGYQARITKSNQIVLGNGSITDLKAAVTSITTTSDGRFKKNIREDVKGLAFIRLLRPVTYNLDVTLLNSFLQVAYNEQDQAAIKAKERIVQTGFIAQEVEQAAIKAGYNFSGIAKPETANDAYGLRYTEFIVPAIKAIQEQQVIIDEQDKKIEKLEKDVEELKALLKGEKSR